MKKQSFRMPFFSVQISAVYIVQFKVMLILVSIDILLTSQKIKGFFYYAVSGKFPILG